MSVRSSSGYYLVLEGPGGAGKSEQIKRLKTRLEAAGREVVLTREPGGTAKAEAIRGELFRLKAEGNISFEEEIRMVYAARTFNMFEVVSPALERGAIVIKDRDYLSTFVFQIVGAMMQGLPRDESMRKLLDWHWKYYVEAGFAQPDNRLILLPSEDECLRRKGFVGHMGDGFDMQGAKFMHEIYLEYAEIGCDLLRDRGMWRGNTNLVDGDFDKAVIEEKIWREIVIGLGEEVDFEIGQSYRRRDGREMARSTWRK